MADANLGLLAFFPSDVGRFFIHALAVAGAFLLGMLATGGLVWLFAKAVFGRPPAPGLARVLRILGGVAAAVVAALLLFGDNGSPGPGGPGRGDGTTTQPTGVGPVTTTAATRPSPPTTTEKSPNPVRVRMLGGNEVKGGPDYRTGRYYVLEGESGGPLDFAELMRKLEERTATPKGPRPIEILLFKDSVLPDHPTVVQLKDWAEQHQPKIGVKVVNQSGGVP